MLNNRWVVLALVGLALLSVSRQLLPLFSEGDRRRLPAPVVSDEVERAAEADPVQRIDSAQRDVRRVDVGSLRWDRRPDRDPFTPAPAVDTAVLEQLLALAQSDTPAAVVRPRWPEVRAIVASATHRYAVIGEEIREPGERFDGFRLMAVATDHVRLQHLASGLTTELKVTR